MSQFRPTKVTPELFDAVKQAMANTGMTRAQIGRKFNLGHTTLQTIHQSATYADYRKHMMRLSASRRLKEVNTPKPQEKTPQTSSQNLTEKFDGPTVVNLQPILDVHVDYKRCFSELVLQALYDVCVALVILIFLFMIRVAM